MNIINKKKLYDMYKIVEERFQGLYQKYLKQKTQ